MRAQTEAFGVLRVAPTVEPLRHELRYLNAARGGGTEVRRLPFVRARASGLPDGLDGLVVTSDLQGVVPAHDGEATLLGVAVVRALEELAQAGKVAPLERMGAVLAGDLFSVPEANARGGFGDVAVVWRAFAARFRWVAGVLGNHDDLGGADGAAALSQGRTHVLDGEVVELDGLRIAGVGLVAGNPKRPGRRAEADQLALIELTAELQPELFVLHEGPSGGPTQPGHAAIRGIVEGARIPLTTCGHVHWDHPLAEHAAGQVLNVDTRVMLLERAGG